MIQKVVKNLNCFSTAPENVGVFLIVCRKKTEKLDQYLSFFVKKFVTKDLLSDYQKKPRFCFAWYSKVAF